MMRRILSGSLAVVIAVMLIFVPVCAVDDTKDSASEIIKWEELEQRIRTGNLNSQALDKNVSSIEVVDYDYLYSSLRKQLDEISMAQSFLVATGDYSGLNSLNASAATLRNTYDDIRDGKPQRDSKNAVKQMRDAQNQVVVAGQTLYINILAMEQSLRDGQRGVETLDRNLTELRLRHSFGQVSDRTVEELERTRENTLSGLNTLKSTISSCKAQLQLLLGEVPDGEVELGELPELVDDEIVEFDVEADLIGAKEKNWNISNAAITLEKAKEDADDMEAEYRSGAVKRYQVTALQRTAEAAEFTYLSAVQDFEFSFREIYRSLQNTQQVLENKIAAVEYQKKQLALSEKQYELGRISYFAYLTAQDNLENAESEVENAERDVFTALNKYRNAVKYGILG